jgi:hypothetical protein
MGHGYEQTSIGEIREILRTRHSVTDVDVLGQTKKPLITLLLEKEAEALANETLQDMGEAGEPPLVGEVEEPVPVPEVVPEFQSPEWHEYLMRQFYEEELNSEGHPTCDGLRRLVQKLIGKITFAGIADFASPEDGNRGTATVVFQVDLFVTMDDHPQTRTQVSYSDIADCNQFNTDQPYSKYQSATAATRAEGRIYRKILGIRKTTAEEISQVAESEEEWVQDDLITEGQISVIDMMCQPDRCDLSVMEYVNCGKNQYANIYVIPHSIASRMIQGLNDIQQDNKPRPDGIGRYEADWKST